MSGDGSPFVGHELEIDEQFDGSELDRSRWIPHYLPHWAGRERSRARFRLTGGQLELFIADDTPEWLPGIEPGLRVSSLQTGCFAGPVGSTIGQHRTRDELVVVEAQPIERLVTPHFGAIEVRACWNPVPGSMVASWMIGFEDEPRRSAEICIFEIFGSEVTTGGALVGMGVHPFGDPTLVDDFEKVRLDIDVGRPHDYAVVWDPQRVTFVVDGVVVKRVDQSPQYPMQLMLDIYELDRQPGRPVPPPLVVEHVRVHRRRDAAVG